MGESIWQVNVVAIFEFIACLKLGVKGCMIVVWGVFICYEMANFSMFDEEDYGDLFITQSSFSSKDENVVSLEENDGFKSVLDPKYSDISDFEDDSASERSLR